MDDALKQMGDLFTELNTHSAVYNDETPLDEVAWTERFPEIQFHQPPRLPKSSSTSEVLA